MEVEGNEGHEQAGKADLVGPHWCSSVTFSSNDEMYGKGVKKGRLRENADKGGGFKKSEIFADIIHGRPLTL